MDYFQYLVQLIYINYDPARAHNPRNQNGHQGTNVSSDTFFLIEYVLFSAR